MNLSLINCCMLTFISLINFRQIISMTNVLKIGNISVETTKKNTISGDDCGLYSSKFIVGGEIASEGAHPWIAAILSSGSFWCSATIINEWWVITAAHIFDDLGVRPFLFSIRVGSNDRTKGKLYKVEKIITHQNYTDKEKQSDIALMKIKGPIELGPNVRPICLPRKSYQDAKSDTLIVAGWGYMDFDVTKNPKLLRSVELNIVPIEECAALYVRANIQIYRSQVCTLDKDKDACQGDSGGPAVEYINGRGTLVGIVSYGVTCADEFPGVFTKVSYFINWIQNLMNNN